MEATLQQIQELRENFFQKEKEDGGDFHPADIARIKNSDDWLRRFLVHNELDMNQSLQMLWDTCDWRKKFGTNDITENNVKREYLEDGSLFVHNRDKDGRSLLIFNCKKHVKGQKDFEELKRCVVYWFERLERLDKGKPITIFFDMAETGLSNMDMEYTKYLISLFKMYYPEFLNYILIFEMPWILNAAFKIIKSWLPAKAVQKIKFVNKSSLKDVVPSDQALKCWGGTDDYVFSFVPEQRTPVLNDNKADDSKKKVHFADGSPLVETPSSGFGDVISKIDGANRSNISLDISPPDAINFTSDGSEVTGSITLTNNDEQIISYKIKTTSPEKFRVRPSTGVLHPSDLVTINVLLQPGYQVSGLSREKFLIMSLVVDSGDLNAQELAELWKQTAGKNVSLHRLKCNLGSAALETTVRNGNAYSALKSVDIDREVREISTGVLQLRESHNRLIAEVKHTQKLQWLTIIVAILFGVIVAFSMSHSEPHEETCRILREHQ
ncbi:motile sperm domain-containing protein 2 [Anabrus simplex]|uniref:motile sperm domain-containing protein 2 n=1 Tax=Anabrus simplex TaxID=316456 RepID=UPI0035A320CE